MFKGIISEIGEISKTEKKEGNLILEIKSKVKDIKIGDSIAIDGACQTIIKKVTGKFTVEAVSETLRKTIFSNYKKGTKVNLELPLTLKDKIDGHLTSGHIDCMGVVKNFVTEGNSQILTIVFPHEISQFLAFKGSIAINGVSLTISLLLDDNFSVALIPHTLKNTNLSLLKTGDKVNLEIDMIARYVERMLEDKEKEAKYNWLQERNLI